MTNSDKRALVEECRKSAMTAKEWCASKGINYSTYMQWASRINKEDRNATSKPMQWADITSVANKIPEKETAEVKLICGKWTISVEPGFSPDLLAKVLKVVDTVC
ncbi:IS66 family insertion sequence element accessory protein TnpA [Desulforamulus ferrireducens]|uniref:Transposase n=1 Tax=Desulforamulus ferrireducens TaxID=1833852 RepID=A0A1S6ITE5_9FIRM|nr:hypothetical protein [Desulforamulus ferrireducens]AQS58046.1 hypothetical protein B0537_02385 [Desulforamulus ferrireducens]